MKDYLAIIRTPIGGSTYGRDTSIFDAVESAVRICVLDCHRYFKIAGNAVSVQVFDVTGRTELTWDHSNVYCTDTGETMELLKAITVQLPELSGRAKIDGPKYLAETERAVARACSFTQAA